jgi:hypothetical protein
VESRSFTLARARATDYVTRSESAFSKKIGVEPFFVGGSLDKVQYLADLSELDLQLDVLKEVVSGLGSGEILDG